MASRVKDLTVGTPWKVITLFSIPIVISYLLQQGYQLADVWMVGNMLPETSFAAVGTTTPLNLFVTMFAIGTATGFSVVTAQRFGKGDMPSMKKSYIHGLILCLIIGIIVTLLACLLTNPLLLAVDINKDNILYQDSYNYIFIIFLGVIPAIFYNYFSSILRAVGNTKMPLVFLIIAALSNILMNYLFIKLTPLGVSGAAIATVLSQLISAICSFIYIQLRYPEFKFKFKELVLEKEDVKIHLRQGLPMGIQFSFLYIALIILQREVNKFDTGAISAYSAANKVDALFMQPLNAIGTAMVTYVGQNYGAKKYSRIKQGIKQMMIIQSVIIVILTVAVLLIKDHFIYVMIKEPTKEAVEYAPIFMFFIALSQFALGTIFLFRNCLQAVGKSLHAMVVSIIQCVVRGLLAIVLPLGIGIYGCAIATPIAWYVSSIFFTVFVIREIFIKLPNDTPEIEVI